MIKHVLYNLQKQDETEREKIFTVRPDLAYAFRKVQRTEKVKTMYEKAKTLQQGKKATIEDILELLQQILEMLEEEINDELEAITTN